MDRPDSSPHLDDLSLEELYDFSQALDALYEVGCKLAEMGYRPRFCLRPGSAPRLSFGPVMVPHAPVNEQVIRRPDPRQAHKAVVQSSPLGPGIITWSEQDVLQVVQDAGGDITPPAPVSDPVPPEPLQLKPGTMLVL